MKRHNHPFEPICSFENLHAAALSAMRGKKGKRPVAAFFANLEEELIGLGENIRMRSSAIFSSILRISTTGF